MKKSYRIKRETEFQAIMQKRQSFANRNFVIYIDRSHHEHFRAGLSVGKKVGNAVTRNYVKRQIRESLLQLEDDINPDYDIIIIARPNVTALKTEEVKKNLKHVFKLANILIVE